LTTIGFVGSGNVGTNIAQAAIANGYDVVLSNSRDPESLSSLVRMLGLHARAATSAEAAAHGDFAVVATPLNAVDSVPVEPLSGKVVICTINYFPERLGHVAEIDNGATTVPGILQKHLPTSRVVRAFNMISAAEISGDGHPEGDSRRRALAVAGDDVEAKRLVSKLYNEFGFDALDIGGLSESWRLDPGQPAFVTRQNLAQLKTNVAKAVHKTRN
jgi:8-hydroxy-5-deazaflavin:NADPH oxidoreductase